MTSPATGSSLRLLPATVAGLQTAITTTHELVSGQDTHARGHGRTLARIAEHLRQAAETLAASAGGDAQPGPATTGHPVAVVTPTSTPDLAQMCSDCITLAVEVLGNEAQDLSPFEVLALTRCVTALCAARACAQELAA